MTIITGFREQQEEYYSEIESKTIEIDDYKTDKFNSYELWESQIDSYRTLINSTRAQLTRPCGSGKSLITSFSVGELLNQNPNLKAIIAVPQRFISKTFQKKRLVYDNIELDWNFQNFCEDDSMTKIQDLVSFLRNKDLGNSFLERIVLVSHASLARCFEYISDEKDIFENTILAIDEAHHVLYHDEDTNTITNGLGNIVNHLIQNDDGSNYLWLISATPFRGDNACIIPDEILKTFNESFLPFHEHWKTMKYLKEIVFNFVMYEEGQLLHEIENLIKLEGKEKTIIFCPYNGYLIDGIGKIGLKDQIEDIIKKHDPENNILDLVEVKNRDERKVVLYNNETSSQIDTILNCKIFNEGSDWPFGERAFDLKPSDTLRVMNQRFGRFLRDIEGKEIIKYYCFLPKESKFANEEERRIHLSKSFNILAATMILKEQIKPLTYPVKKGVNRKKKTTNPIMEAFPSDNDKTKFVNKVITKLINLKGILGETPKKKDVYSVINNCLNTDNILENQEEIIDYTLGMIYNFQPSLNPNSVEDSSEKIQPKKPTWIEEGKDISFLIDEGFDKVMEVIYDNLLIYSAGVCNIETFEELESILSTCNSVEEWKIFLKEQEDSKTGLIPGKKTDQPSSCVNMMIKYPDEFNEFNFELQWKNPKKWFDFISELADPETNKVQLSITELPRGFQTAKYTHKKLFDKFSFIDGRKEGNKKRGEKDLEKHIIQVEKFMNDLGYIPKRTILIESKLTGFDQFLRKRKEPLDIPNVFQEFCNSAGKVIGYRLIGDPTKKLYKELPPERRKIQNAT